MKDPTGNPAPVGGFQNGGWYGGYQYYNGSFAPKAGVIHPNSPQQGAGQEVSEEVNKQSSIAQGKAPDAIQNYIKEQNQIQQTNPYGSNYSAGNNVSASGDGSGTGLNLSAPTSGFDLQKVYDTANNNPEYTKAKTEYDAILKRMNDAEFEINDNPLLSEAERVGRVQKLKDQGNKELARVQGQLSNFQADAQTKVDIALKQYDINSQEYQKNLSYLNTLISTGAIAGASQTDLANLARSTGMSTEMLSSIVSKANQGEPPQIVTNIGEDGSLNIVAIDKNTGAVVSTNKVAGVGKTSGGSGSSSATVKESAKLVGQFLLSNKNSYGHVSPEVWRKALEAYVNDGVGSESTFISLYKNYADPNRGDFQKAYGFAKPKK